MWAGREELGDNSKGGIALRDLPCAAPGAGSAPAAPAPAASRDNALDEDF